MFPVIVILREGPGEIAAANFPKFFGNFGRYFGARLRKNTQAQHVKIKAIIVAYSFTERIVPTIAQTAKNPNPNAACVISTVMVALFISADARQTVANPSLRDRIGKVGKRFLRFREATEWLETSAGRYQKLGQSFPAPI